MASTFKMFVDEKGIPYSEYGEYKGIQIGQQRSVLSVAERGLVYWNRFFSSAESSVLLSYDWDHRYPFNKDREPTSQAMAESMLFACADWLIEDIVEFSASNFSAWVHPYAISYHTKPLWKSAHTQAVGLQLLARAYELSGNNKYLAPTDQLLNAFEVAVEDGGLLRRTKQGGYWYDKLADASNDQPMILNGMLFSLLGLYDFSTRRRSAKARHLFDHGIQGCLPCLEYYDLGDWSAYDIFGKRASPHYHEVHIQQLARLGKVSGIAQLKEYAEKFISYREKQADKISVVR